MGPRPLGPIGHIRSHAAACSHAVAWVRDRPGPSNCMAAYGPYGPQGPWTMGPMGPRGLGPIFFLTYICLIHLFVYFVYLFNICLIVLPIELPMVLPIVLPIELAIVLPMYCLLYCLFIPLGAIRGGERGNFMYFKYNFSSVVQKKIYIYSSILTFRYASFGDDEIGKMLYR